MNRNRKNIDRLKELIFNSIKPLINNDYVLLDIPNHRNIGDSLIWNGEKEFFKSLEFKCLGEYNRYTFKNNYVPSEKTIILLHGGGNFGDLYLSSQLFKRKIVKEFPNNRIIMLPQTVDYLNESNKIEDFSVFNKHKNLYIFTRDNDSFEVVKESFIYKENVFLCPDMAFYLNYDHLITEKNINKKVLLLERTDGEAVKHSIDQYVVEDDYDINDWPTYKYKNILLNRVGNYYEVLQDKICMFFKYIPLGDKLFDSAYGFKPKGTMERQIDCGIEFINGYGKVYTTRLHGLILCILLDKEVVIIDNAHKKSKRFFSCWLKDFYNVTLK